MRLHIVSILLIVAWVTTGAQDSTAEASPPPSALSAYDILGVSPYADGLASTAIAIASTGLDNEAEPTEPVATEPAPTVPDPTVPDPEVPDPEVPGLAIPSDPTLNNELPATEEPIELAEPTEPMEPIEPSTTEMEEAETILMEEIGRLLAERDSLYQEIIELQAENKALTSQVADLAYYKNRSDELESQISQLEAELLEKETALAAADALLAEVSEKLVEEGVRLASSEQARFAAEASLADAQAALAAAKATGAVVAGTTATTGGYLAGWALDTSRFTTKLRDGFDGSVSRMGSWRINGATAAQTDASQYFSRLELPLAQGKATTLYRFRTRSSGSGWVGIGLHLYVENVRKKYGYGEGKSLLVWFTRDKAARGDDATYLQLYRSDDDVVMERMFDAELSDGLELSRLVEVVYDPVAEYIAISVDGVLRIVYKTFFGRDSGAMVSLRTLGGGGSFSDFSVWSE